MQSWVGASLQRDQDLIHQLCVRTAGQRLLLCTAHLGRSHHLHGLRNLRGVSNGFDSPTYVLSVCHLENHRQVVLNSSSAAFNCDSISLSSSFFSRIAPSSPPFRVCSKS